jgi:hypothetical protein
MKMICFSSDNKQNKSKHFAFVPIISEPNQIALLRPRLFGPKRKQFARIKEFFGPNQYVLLLFR